MEKVLTKNVKKFKQNLRGGGQTKTLLFPEEASDEERSMKR